MSRKLPSHEISLAFHAFTIMSDSGYLVKDDSPKRKGSNKDIPLHSSDALTRLIEYQLEQCFCITSNARNAEVARIPILSESAPQSQKTLSVQELPIESAWNALRESLASTKETLMYKPLCRFLTLLAERKFLFIPWECKTTGGLYRQDILVVNAQSGETDHFLGGGLDLAWLPDRFHSTREEGKTGSKVCYSDIQMVGEVKACDAPKEPSTLFKHAIQVLRYQFTVSRYQPQHAFHIGILAYRDGFFIVDYYPDQAFFSELFKWEDKDTAWKALRGAISNVQNRSFTTKQFASLESTDRHGQARL
jgi:hypothetical protein